MLMGGSGGGAGAAAKAIPKGGGGLTGSINMGSMAKAFGVENAAGDGVNFKRAAVKTFQGSKSALQQESPTQAMAEFAKPFGKAGEFTGAVIESVDKLRKWGDTLAETNMKFAEFSGAMAQVQAQTEVNRLNLQREQGDRRAATARELETSRNRLNKAMAPMEDYWNNFRNRVGALVNNAMANAAEKVNEFGKKIGLWGGDEKPGVVTTNKDWLEARMDKREQETIQRRPARMRR